MDVESHLIPSIPPAEFDSWRKSKSSLESLVARLQKKAVHRTADKERREARQHAATWKLLALFKQKWVELEVPPPDQQTRIPKLKA
jgi:hypothetical protein